MYGATPAVHAVLPAMLVSGTGTLLFTTGGEAGNPLIVPRSPRANPCGPEIQDWAEIRRLHRAENMPVEAIVRALGISRNAVRAAFASDAPPKYHWHP